MAYTKLLASTAVYVCTPVLLVGVQVHSIVVELSKRGFSRFQLLVGRPISLGPFTLQCHLCKNIEGLFDKQSDIYDLLHVRGNASI